MNKGVQHSSNIEIYIYIVIFILLLGSVFVGIYFTTKKKPIGVCTTNQKCTDKSICSCPSGTSCDSSGKCTTPPTVPYCMGDNDNCNVATSCICPSGTSCDSSGKCSPRSSTVPYCTGNDDNCSIFDNCRCPSENPSCDSSTGKCTPYKPPPVKPCTGDNDNCNVATSCICPSGTQCTSTGKCKPPDCECGQLCTDGFCACPEGKSCELSSGFCVFTEVDANCGTCPSSCPADAPICTSIINRCV